MERIRTTLLAAAALTLAPAAWATPAQPGGPGLAADVAATLDATTHLQRQRSLIRQRLAQLESSLAALTQQAQRPDRARLNTRKPALAIRLADAPVAPPLARAELHIAPPQLAPWSPLGYLAQLDDGRLDNLRGGFTTTSGLQVSFGIERAIYVNGDLITTTSLNVTAGLGEAITANAQQRVASAIAETPLAAAPTATPATTTAAAPAVATAPTLTAAPAAPAAPAAATTSAAAMPAPAAPIAAAPTTTAAPSTLLSNANVSLQSAANGGVMVVQNGTANQFQAGTLDPAAIGTVIQNSLDNQNIQNITMINASVNSMDVLKARQMRETLNSAIIDSLRR